MVFQHNMHSSIKPGFHKNNHTWTNGCWLNFCQLVPIVFKLNSKIQIDSSCIVIREYMREISFFFYQKRSMNISCFCRNNSEFFIVLWDKYFFEKSIPTFWG